MDDDSPDESFMSPPGKSHLNFSAEAPPGVDEKLFALPLDSSEGSRRQSLVRTPRHTVSRVTNCGLIIEEDVFEVDERGVNTPTTVQTDPQPPVFPHPVLVPVSPIAPKHPSLSRPIIVPLSPPPRPRFIEILSDSNPSVREKDARVPIIEVGTLLSPCAPSMPKNPFVTNCSGLKILII